MITLVDSGTFKLVETQRGTKLLQLNHTSYAWILPPRVGSLLVYSLHPHNVMDILSEGHFDLYDVDEEPNIVNCLHLEVEVGRNKWQGYLLPNGLPDRIRTRARIIPAHELVPRKRAVSTPFKASVPRQA